MLRFKPFEDKNKDINVNIQLSAHGRLEVFYDHILVFHIGCKGGGIKLHFLGPEEVRYLKERDIELDEENCQIVILG